MKRSIYAFIAVVFLLLQLAGCSDQVKNSDPLKNTGDHVSPEDITKYNDLLTEDSGPIVLNDSTVYYWTRSGSKLHIFKTCQSLGKSSPEEIVSGTLKDAYYEEKAEPCSFCLKKAGIDASAFPSFVPDEYSTEDITTTTEPTSIIIDENTVLYWTVGGLKLHIFITCQSLSKSNPENIKSGNIALAYYSEKTSPCSFCLKKAGLEDFEFPVFVPDETESPDETVSPSDTEPSKPKVDVDENTMLYWTEGGTKLHIFVTCQSLSKADPENIKSGNIALAYYSGKTSPCSFCLKKAGLDASEFPVFVPDETEAPYETTRAPSETETPKFVFTGNTVYYWTKSGTKLHFFSDCGALLGSREICCGNLHDAYNSKKTEPCAFCLKRGNVDESEFPVYIP